LRGNLISVWSFPFSFQGLPPLDILVSLMINKGMGEPRRRRVEAQGFPKAPHADPLYFCLGRLLSVIVGLSVLNWHFSQPISSNWETFWSHWSCLRNKKWTYHLHHFSSLNQASPKDIEEYHKSKGGNDFPNPTHIEYLNKNTLLIFRYASVFNTWKVPSKYLKKIQMLGSLMNFFFF
jgi:hypothetical protein